MSLKVFYLDDEPDLCEIFVDQFSSESISIQSFTDCSAALAAAQVATPNVLFIDYRLQSTTGDIVAQQMPPGIATYLLTGEASVVTQFKFAGILGKPFSIQAIGEVLEHELKGLVKKARD